MITLYFSHPICQKHDNGESHPETAQRISRLEDALIANRLLDFVMSQTPRKATEQDVLRVHTDALWQKLTSSVQPDRIVYLDDETAIAPDSIEAALYASGAVLDSVDALMKGTAENSFCNIRPPGHHAEKAKSMGFCLINHAAIGAAYAIERYGLERVAILDFDVHHGNGTEDYANSEPKVLFASSYELDIYPFSSHTEQVENVIKMPLSPGSQDPQFLDAWQTRVWPKLRAWKPQLILLSAGFDGHRWDSMANLDLSESGYAQWTSELKAIAQEVCDGKIISVLEGGYELRALPSSAVAHFKALTEL